MKSFLSLFLLIFTSSVFADVAINGSLVSGEVLSVSYLADRNLCVADVMITKEIPVYSNEETYLKFKPLSNVHLKGIKKNECSKISSAVQASLVMDLAESITDFTGFIYQNDPNDVFTSELKVYSFNQKVVQ